MKSIDLGIIRMKFDCDFKSVKIFNSKMSGNKSGMNLNMILCLDIYEFNLKALPVCSGTSECHQKLRRKILGGGDGGHYRHLSNGSARKSHFRGLWQCTATR